MNTIRLTQNTSQGQGIVHEILNSYLSNPGKLIRPKLIAKLGRLLGLEEKDFAYISKASELIHNASLIHDDVVDEALVRRDRPTLNSVMTNSRAVLAGDYLLANAIAELVSVKQYDQLKTLSQTLEEIVEGEFLQDSLRTKDVISFDDLVNVSHKKTGALISWGCQSVAQTANCHESLSLMCLDLGKKIGLAFQMMDDNLDYSLESGKEYAKDLKEGLINFTTLNLLNLNPELMYTIYQLRGVPNFTAPWSNEQMNEAMAETKKSADLLFVEIFLLLGEIADKASVPRSSEQYGDLKSFLEKLQGRIR